MVGIVGSRATDKTWQSWSPVHGLDALEGDLSTSESHVVKTTCDLDKSWSPFGRCVTMSWHLHGFSGPTNDARHGNGSGSAISRHQFSAEMLRHKVSMTSLHWQTSLQTQKSHALTQFTLVNQQGSLCIGDWVPLTYGEHSHGALSNVSWHCWIVCCF